jgi:hypothetical protein
MHDEKAKSIASFYRTVSAIKPASLLTIMHRKSKVKPISSLPEKKAVGYWVFFLICW